MATSAAKANRNAEIVTRLEAENERLKNALLDARDKLALYYARDKSDVGAAEDAMEARRKAILEADAEYQALVAAWREAKDTAARNQSVAWNSYKITVGVTNSMFFHVKAQGDSWEDVIGQLTAKEAA